MTDELLPSSLLPPSTGYVTTLYSEQYAAGVAAGLCVLSMVVVLLFVPRSTKDPTKAAGSGDSYSMFCQRVCLYSRLPVDH